MNSVDNRLLGNADLTALRASLQADRTFRLQQLSDLARGTASKRSPGHAEVSRKLAAAARAALEDTEAALDRMDSGQYGRCDRCGGAIGVQLLRIYPQAVYCAQCRRVMRGAQ